MDEVKFLTNKLKLDVLCLTETWLTPLIVDSSISIDGYSIFRRDRADGRRGGGVCIFTKNSLSVNERTDLNDDDNTVENVWLDNKSTIF